MEGLLQKAKECLSIIQSSTLKDSEITMLINAAIADLERQGIVVDLENENELVNVAIMMFVKGNFGNVDIKNKELAQKTYGLLCCNLSLSSGYKESDGNA